MEDRQMERWIEVSIWMDGKMDGGAGGN